MSLNWSWKEKVGELDYKNYEGKIETWTLYQGNAMLIALTETKENYWLSFFFNDRTHMRKCLGIEKGYDNMFNDTPWTEIRLNEIMDIQDMILLIKAIRKKFPRCKIIIADNSELNMKKEGDK